LAENGLPVGAQLVGHRFEDAAAARIETAAGAAFRRPRRIAPAPTGT
jgi:Asp-tRNA(Asn)/Glu-tRNA(Gln) amidotransferase A subunit family amidase